MTARMAIASDPEMSTRAASAAHASRNDAATTAVPKTSSPGTAGRWTPLSWTNRAGMTRAAQSTSGRASFSDMAPSGGLAAEPEAGNLSQATRLAKVSSTHAGPGAGGPWDPQDVYGQVCRTTPLQVFFTNTLP